MLVSCNRLVHGDHQGRRGTVNLGPFVDIVIIHLMQFTVFIIHVLNLLPSNVSTLCSTTTILGTNGLNSADVPLSNKQTRCAHKYETIYSPTNLQTLWRYINAFYLLTYLLLTYLLTI